MLGRIRHRLTTADRKAREWTHKNILKACQPFCFIAQGRSTPSGGPPGSYTLHKLMPHPDFGPNGGHSSWEGSKITFREKYWGGGTVYTSESIDRRQLKACFPGVTVKPGTVRFVYWEHDKMHDVLVASAQKGKIQRYTPGDFIAVSIMRS